MDGRKELKFLLDSRMLFQIEKRISCAMKRDPNQNGDSYNIRSIYFDSPEDTCFHENQSGIDTRKKYRIRIYDHSDDPIKAEIKSKYRDTTHKESAKLTKEQFYACMNGRSLREILPEDPPKPLLEFAQKIIAEGYRPVSIVSYDRSAYIYTPCNVRVTFDKNIAASADLDAFFEENLISKPVCKPGMHVLEVKYDEFLPDHILTLLKAGDLRRTSFSKYYLSRLTLGGTGPQA